MNVNVYMHFFSTNVCSMSLSQA